jgi:hypothetical protein
MAHYAAIAQSLVRGSCAGTAWVPGTEAAAFANYLVRVQRVGVRMVSRPIVRGKLTRSLDLLALIYE